MKWLARGVGVIGLLIIAVVAWAVIGLNRWPSLAPFESMYQRVDPGGPVFLGLEPWAN